LPNILWWSTVSFCVKLMSYVTHNSVTSQKEAGHPIIRILAGRSG
jgi:hypothetical protein